MSNYNMKKVFFMPGMAMNMALCETIRVELDDSGLIKYEDTPYFVWADFFSGRSVVIGRFKTEEEAIKFVNIFVV